MSVILIDSEGYCFCNCAMKCVKSKIGSSFRCHKDELIKEGYKILQTSSPKLDKVIQDKLANNEKIFNIK